MLTSAARYAESASAISHLSRDKIIPPPATRLMIIKDKTTITDCAAIPKISILRFCFRNKAAAAENNGMSMVNESIFLFPVPSQLAHVDVSECLINSKKKDAHNQKRHDHIKKNSRLNE